VSIPGKNYNLSLANDKFVTVGDIARPLIIGPNTAPDGTGTIGRQLASAVLENQVRLNLADPNYHGLFKYLTVFDPTVDGIDNNGDGYGAGANVDPNELKIPGRININTAPWFVIAQLPWVSQRKGGTDYSLAQAIVKYRDELKTPKGFESIGELMNVTGMDYYKTQTGDLTGFPDLTPGGSTGDGAPDDFEERDVIFARISNLVTVRSDVFTAYILVRIGTDGPQKRAMAILDRSNVRSGDGKVRIVALHPVPDPR
jgi:DNA uptake protein ComE-like DNA-binding protein